MEEEKYQWNKLLLLKRIRDYVLLEIKEWIKLTNIDLDFPKYHIPMSWQFYKSFIIAEQIKA